ncbi:aminoglycoside phosphotransferase family protein [Pseudoalteromonas sp. T1lg24]|uniref:aminoglycoside phosphotransferase family protein n=1 Tax=Pseudoalteromonas sp. T1lg24 TaxID=2077099 RepID=UPI001319E3F9|nr:phosphotransferase [Pseudoalteromonas sp. T1lg24]
MHNQMFDAFLTQNLPNLEQQNAFKVELITGDASFRKYFRVFTDNHTYILMVSPPNLVDNEPFIELNHLFSQGSFKVPQILAVDKELGLLLIEDLGSTHFADCLGQGCEQKLYHQAIDMLPNIAKLAKTNAMKPYDAAFIDLELEIFNHWLIEQFCQFTMDTGAQKTWQQVKQQLINALEMQPKVTMHRDYHSRNLMLWQQQLAIIDYQDAVQGPLTYDLVSLTKDCYHILPKTLRQELVRYGFTQYEKAGMTVGLSFDDFELLYTLTGIQRHLKAAGIFCRLSIRDNKQGYLPHVLDTMHYIVEACDELAHSFPVLGYFSQWLKVSVLPSLKAKL